MQNPAAAPSSLDLTGWLVNQGPLGVGLVLAIALILRLWRENETLSKRLDEIQEQRIRETKEAGEKMTKIAQGSIAATRRLYRALGEKDDGLDPE